MGILKDFHREVGARFPFLGAILAPVWQALEACGRPEFLHAFYVEKSVRHGRMLRVFVLDPLYANMDHYDTHGDIKDSHGECR